MAPTDGSLASARRVAADSERRPVLLAAACPAFQGGCPYASDGNVMEWIKANRPDAIKACPAFKEGCPFNDVQNMEALRRELEKLPPSHAVESPVSSIRADGRPEGIEHTSSHTALLEMLQAVHKASQTVKGAVGGDCPVFQQACPFKNCLTSRGTPLALELETRSWGIVVLRRDEAEPALAPESSPDADAEVAEGLAKRLKEGTKEAHSAAESVHFIREFIRGRVSRDLYAQLIVNLYHVYAALEAALDAHCEHVLLEPLYFPDELNRAGTLKKDVEFYCGPNWEELKKPSEVTREYVKRIQELAKESPELLVPHAYTRYLGDLSGGQVLRRAAVRGLQLPADGSGVRFYIFQRIPDAKVFKNMYRARMDNLPADKATADRMVVEANYAFNLNTRIFQELDALGGFEADPVVPPSVSPAPSGVVGTLGLASAASACPFAALAAQGAEMPEGHPPLAGGHPIAKTTRVEPAVLSSAKVAKVCPRHLEIAAFVALVAIMLALMLGGRQFLR